MSGPVRTIPWPAKDPEAEILDREWIVTNGLGGYAAGTVAGVITRRFHGLLIAALPNPFGRQMMLNDVSEQLRFADGRVIQLGGERRMNSLLVVHAAEYFSEFRIECGLPFWTYQVAGITIERRLVMLHRQNTVHISTEAPRRRSMPARCNRAVYTEPRHRKSH